MDTVLEPLDEHAVLLLLVQLGLLLATARGLGELAVRMRLPSVVGELLAGVVLGPSIFGLIAPGVFRRLVPAEASQFHLLEVVALLGVILLLVVTGIETDVNLIMRKGRSAALVSLFGIVVPFVTGFALGQVLPDAFIADPSQRLVFSLFIGTALGISAIPVIAKVLIEMGIVRRDIGQITLAAGMIDDTIGWILLSVVAGLARSGSVEATTLGRSLLAVIATVGLMFTFGRRVIAWLFRAVDNAVGGSMAKLTLVVVLALLTGSVTHLLGIEAVLGAFLVGIVVGQVKRFDAESRTVLETMTMGVFAPIFFAASGLRVDLRLLSDPAVLAVGLAVLATAIAGKFVGAALGARLSGMGGWESLSLGAGMNARGAIEIIVATIGLSLGILTPEMYTIVLMVAIVTSLMAPPILRWTLQKIPLSDEERQRLQDDERRRDAFIPNLHRVLLPTRGGLNSRLAARLLGSVLTDEETEITTLVVLRDAHDEDETRAADETLAEMDRYFEHLPSQDRRRVILSSNGDVAATIVAEAQRGFDLVVLGGADVTDSHHADELLEGVVDDVVTELSMPMLMVSWRGDQRAASNDHSIDRILLPTTGARSDHSFEVAAAIARHHAATVDVLHVAEGHPGEIETATGHDVVQDIVDRARDHLKSLGVTDIVTNVLYDRQPGEAIVRRIERTRTDLAVLSANRRPISERVYFGYRAEYVLRTASCPVVLVS